ncbi:MAG: hypothetical protein AB7R89_00600 [Dehalococcoidia bacterium]
MVARRARRQSQHGLTEYERGLQTLRNAPISEEDPADFWGPDWERKLGDGDADIAAGRIERFESDEAFLRALMALGAKRADL